jgi:hypothetical protein
MKHSEEKSCSKLWINKRSYCIWTVHLLYKQGLVIATARNLTEGKSCVGNFGFAVFEYQKYGKNRNHQLFGDVMVYITNRESHTLILRAQGL